ncbi:hypothetical protein BEI60_05445 [Eisenbergiella tayi]|nr:hypothetical protein BEI60_05445 [Eisenbergiella tayi]
MIKLGAGSREPGAGSREPGAGSREPGAGSREPGAGSREPGVQGAASERKREQIWERYFCTGRCMMNCWNGSGTGYIYRAASFPVTKSYVKSLGSVQ